MKKSQLRLIFICCFASLIFSTEIERLIKENNDKRILQRSGATASGVGLGIAEASSLGPTGCPYCAVCPIGREHA
jgi:hypothetical protein